MVQLHQSTIKNLENLKWPIKFFLHLFAENVPLLLVECRMVATTRIHGYVSTEQSTSLTGFG